MVRNELSRSERRELTDFASQKANWQITYGTGRHPLRCETSGSIPASLADTLIRRAPCSLIVQHRNSWRFAGPAVGVPLQSAPYTFIVSIRRMLTASRALSFAYRGAVYLIMASLFWAITGALRYGTGTCTTAGRHSASMSSMYAR